MKTNPSRYILAAEILTIILFHAVKLKQSEKIQAETAYNQTIQNIPPQKPLVENKTGAEYMLVNLVK